MSVFKGLLGQKESFISKIAELEVELGEYRCVVARGARVVEGCKQLRLSACERCHLSHILSHAFPCCPSAGALQRRSSRSMARGGVTSSSIACWLRAPSQKLGLWWRRTATRCVFGGALARSFPAPMARNCNSKAAHAYAPTPAPLAARVGAA